MERHFFPFFQHDNFSVLLIVTAWNAVHIGILQHKRLFPSVNGYNLQLTLQFSELQWKKTEVKFESRGDWRKGLFIMGETEPTE